MSRGSALLRHPIAVGFALVVLFGIARAAAGVAEVFLLGFFAVVLATLLTYPLDLLARWIPRPAALLLTLLALGVSLGAATTLAAPILVEEAGALAPQLSVALDQLNTAFQHARGGPFAALPAGDAVIAEIQRHLTAELTRLLSGAVPVALSFLGAIGLGIATLALAFFLAYQPDSYRAALRRLVPGEHEPVLDELWRRLGCALRRWTGGILVSMAIMGVLTGVGLYLAGIPGYLTLGLITFLGTFVPYAGAVASAIPGLAVGLAASPRHLLYAAIVYTLVHVVEGYLVEPLIMRRAVELHPAVLLFWQLAFGAVFGVPGVVVATPLLVCVTSALEYLYIERALGKPATMR